MLTVIIFYKGTPENIKQFVEDMISSGTVNNIRKEEGNIRYQYFFPLEDDSSLVLIDSWINQEALDKHHKSKMMEVISKLRDKYDLHMEVEKYISTSEDSDTSYIRK